MIRNMLFPGRYYISRLSILCQEPLHAPLDGLLDANPRPVTQQPLGLANVVIPRHAGVHNPLSRKGRRLPNQGEKSLAGQPKNPAQVRVQHPDVFLAPLLAGLAPDSARKVPEVDGGIIRDEEGLAVDLLVVQRPGLGGCGDEEEARREKVGVGDIADVAEVEDVVIAAHLNARPALSVDIDEVLEHHGVAFAEDTCWADGAGQEVAGSLAICFEDYFFGFGLRSRGGVSAN
jgi:hypothetical protein